MNELKTIDSQPAKIEFNYEEIEKDLEQNLKKYDGLTFTEDDASECKKTIAELRKGKKAVDGYRKKMKKELTAPVAEFENKCKTLNQKFDDVINPLVEQHDQFEEKRKKEKHQKLEQIISDVKVESGLSEKYANQLMIKNEHLAKSRSIKSVQEEWEMEVKHLKTQQEKEESDKQVIQSAVQLANSEHGVSLSENPYFNLLDYKDVKDIKAQILDDAQAEVDKQEAEKRKKEAQAQEEQKVEESSFEWIPTIDDMPFEPPNDDIMPDPFAEKPVTTKSYKVTGTSDQIERLEQFMTDNGLKWSELDV